MMKTVLCHSVHKWQVLAKQVTNYDIITTLNVMCIDNIEDF